jgi:hypothetical protein
MHLRPSAVARAMRTKHSGVQGRRARSVRYYSSSHAGSFPLAGKVRMGGDRSQVLPAAPPSSPARGEETYHRTASEDTYK